MNDHLWMREAFQLDSLVERYKQEKLELMTENTRLKEALTQIMTNAHELDSHSIWKICVNALHPKEGETL